MNIIKVLTILTSRAGLLWCASGRERQLLRRLRGFFGMTMQRCLMEQNSKYMYHMLLIAEIRLTSKNSCIIRIDGQPNGSVTAPRSLLLSTTLHNLNS
ncbi:hypothetical protein PF005_g17581 [Phytophthora fragariae]|uniref:Secreted protein n=1 Tax=Phytophthora fragariae TaxID=53985 RepID=A0A6A3XAI2_9STRA|nr:hypothetical protein PF003_g3070 [Phytophthora fragariae]KAE8931641.1 hypothetical protein PF009_g18301 [Phytophthora fragariae]KAE8977856.1 hypothetical protein PF011_g23484 [Phytophthora fragariae]KAE9071216.1 hypothetical protein PF007_g26644 [Phytophthora fragariae]KAE9099444.1 hypothetical protein PF010_g15193 [Phytophthora fragariae]